MPMPPNTMRKLRSTMRLAAMKKHRTMLTLLMDTLRTHENTASMQAVRIARNTAARLSACGR
jgi:hypothetical protein